MEDTDDDDGELTTEEQQAVDKLSAAEVAAIDAALLAQVTERWRKVAMIVATVIASDDDPGRRLGIRDVYYASRVGALVDSGLIESQGNLRRMRFSEVRRRKGP